MVTIRLDRTILSYKSPKMSSYLDGCSVKSQHIYNLYKYKHILFRPLLPGVIVEMGHTLLAKIFICRFMLLDAVATLLVPVAARSSVSFLIFLRFLTGLGQVSFFLKVE